MGIGATNTGRGAQLLLRHPKLRLPASAEPLAPKNANAIKKKTKNLIVNFQARLNENTFGSGSRTYWLSSRQLINQYVRQKS